MPLPPISFWRQDGERRRRAYRARELCTRPNIFRLHCLSACANIKKTAGAKARKLTSRRWKLVQQLCGLGPVLRASLIERFTPCGKPGCKCMQGEKHGPSYYLTVS
jgi:hypothetical protein